ncbi:hypothetical protein [Mesoplasma seiffertii]|uniref:hypothetical protein n=1 Tax=Mesoplasma seiffertii TaxID=28224 RepID=UPI00146FA6E9|nr:hypothetical protein [Mesoplasma seiffertii]
MKEKVTISLYLFFAIVPLFCVTLDLFLSTILPDSEYGNMVNNFDFSIINQIIYFSVWSALITSVWGICMSIEYFNHKMPNWVKSRDTFTMVAVFNFIVFIVYMSGMIASMDNIVGFNTWYKILKSVLEHFIAPPILFLFYFLQKTERRNIKDYSVKNGLKTMIIPTIYVIFVTIRCVMIHTFIDNIDNAFTPFPYDQIDPYTKPMYLVIPGTIALIVVPYLLGIGFNYLANINKWKPIPMISSLDMS